MAPAEYSAGVNALCLKLADEVLFNKGGVMAVTVIRNREAPCLQAKEELGNDVDIEAVMECKFENEALALDRGTWKVVKRTIFDEFITHCEPRMREILETWQDGRWLKQVRMASS